MNWLAHVFLSEPSTEFRLGNLLADLVRGPERDAMSLDFRRGASCHRAIDAFTDAHPIVRRSRERLGPHYRRFSGVLVDVFYDHCLASQWATYASLPLDAFTADFYSDVRAHPIALPAAAQHTLDRIVRHDLLGQYRHIDGVQSSLRRVSAYLAQRWRRDFDLEASVRILVADDAGFAADFAEFFPQLRQHIEKLTPSASL